MVTAAWPPSATNHNLILRLELPMATDARPGDAMLARLTVYPPTPLMQNSELAKLIVQYSYRVAPLGGYFTLASGDKSKFYFDCQRTTLLARAMPLIGKAFLEKFAEMGLAPQAVGGLVLGADPIMTAILFEAYHMGLEILGFRVRKEPKNHGTQQWIEGPVSTPMRVVVVDDVVTRGSSVIQAIRKCREEGYDVIGCVVLVDRQEKDGIRIIQKELGGAPVAPIFSWDQLKPIIEREYGLPESVE